MGIFQNARPVWGENLSSTVNQFLGFFSEVRLEKEQEIVIAIAARSYYRLYINGAFRASGPARTAHGCCRVDKIAVLASGTVKMAIEVVALDKPGKYSNDCTLEQGLLVAEITDAGGRVLSATGDGTWRYKELLYRRSLVELMSHSRGIIEWYDLDENSFLWRTGAGEGLVSPISLKETVLFLPRRAPYANYRPIPMETLEDISDVVGADRDGDEGITIQLSRHMHRTYYEMVPPENQFLKAIRQERDVPFSGVYTLGGTNGVKSITLQSGAQPAAVTFGRKTTELGFIDFTITAEKDCCVDVIHSDHLHFTGAFKGNTYVARYSLKPGNYHLTTFEPKLTRYIKIILRTQGRVTLGYPILLDDAYDDARNCFFSCSDGELNAIYEASRRTLRLNTLDIFMDCPERERGGWLCDSQFSAQSAWQMFGDISVERDFLENFMLTDGTKKWKGFFPEVYPASKADDEDVGITTWSFWLAVQLYDYYRRSGDRNFINACEKRVGYFVEGLLSLRGESGLLENLPDQFVDWSLSNKAFCLEPINIPNNCLAVCALERLAELYDKPLWKTTAGEMRAIIESMDNSASFFKKNGDSAAYVNGQLQRGDCLSEAGAAYEIWSGFHLDDTAYINGFVNTMGYAPKYRPSPNFGKANIFIGLIVRFDVLARLGKINTLVKELKDVYLAQLRDGSGTFFEGYSAFSGCHGANGLVGTLLTNKVLGLGQPDEHAKMIKIAPDPCGLRWARGAAKCTDGMIFMNYRADEDAHVLDISLALPTGWHYDLEIPSELCGWRILLNGIAVQ
ncbi:MAG TPA: hypothetical protein DEB31_04490 [Clostridiales bacterium]|nr:hypothetical protein [Clostridiales bacterium]